jgi:hypothetical protein
MLRNAGPALGRALTLIVRYTARGYLLRRSARALMGVSRSDDGELEPSDLGSCHLECIVRSSRTINPAHPHASFLSHARVIPGHS